MTDMRQIGRTALAANGEEYLALLASDADGFARTADDVREMRGSGTGPLSKLSEEDFEAFLGSLEFKGGGLAHGYYKPLMSSMTLTDIFEVFEGFGMSQGYFLEIHEAKCSGGVCEFDFWSFCASNCSSTTEPEQ